MSNETEFPADERYEFVKPSELSAKPAFIREACSQQRCDNCGTSIVAGLSDVGSATDHLCLNCLAQRWKDFDEMPRDSYSTTIINNELVTWLRQQGANKNIVHDFILEKGMGERLEVTILNNDVVQFTFYGQQP